MSHGTNIQRGYWKGVFNDNFRISNLECFFFFLAESSAVVVSPWFSDLLGVLSWSDFTQSLALTPDPVVVADGETDWVELLMLGDSVLWKHHMMCNTGKGPVCNLLDNAGPDQPAHKRRLIWAFIDHFTESVDTVVYADE